MTLLTGLSLKLRRLSNLVRMTNRHKTIRNGSISVTNIRQALSSKMTTGNPGLKLTTGTIILSRLLSRTLHNDALTRAGSLTVRVFGQNGTQALLSRRSRMINAMQHQRVPTLLTLINSNMNHHSRIRLTIVSRQTTHLKHCINGLSGLLNANVLMTRTGSNDNSLMTRVSFRTLGTALNNIMVTMTKGILLGTNVRVTA